MKKLLVLSLVLAMAGISTAALEIVPGLTYEVDLAAQKVTFYGENVVGYLFNLAADAGALEGAVVAPAFTTVNDPGLWAADYGEVAWVGASASNQNPVTGEIFSIFYSDPAVMSISFYSSGFMGDPGITFPGGTVNLAGMTIVPEPMTMGLLGLGALFLRRRK